MYSKVQKLPRVRGGSYTGMAYRHLFQVMKNNKSVSVL